MRSRRMEEEEEGNIEKGEEKHREKRREEKTARIKRGEVMHDMATLSRCRKVVKVVFIYFFLHFSLTQKARM